MRTASRLAALFVVLVTVALWFFGGPNFGPTRLTETVRTMDSTSGTESISHEVRFLPGLDFLAIGLVLAMLIWVTGRLFRPEPSGS